jgi:hypothetical protein
MNDRDRDCHLERTEAESKVPRLLLATSHPQNRNFLIVNNGSSLNALAMTRSCE